ncbi:MAG: TlpA disulfide reductase family protein [Candidatus Marinimicrobia bacterium]|jgi:thiol-disulfide isomerase/thioredoxin|nr:TlpA disulfide reductase family protein [Candidatus Neomarinimicrobiota bacterium]|tara:strand:+ start:2212 stop:2727 length:516 start_codon:yes stop_codon:yes gene_type:complete
MQLFRLLKRSRILLLFLFSFSCSRSPVDLQEVTAEDILTAVAEHKGEKAVLVNYWATWCAPCVEEFPMIVELSKEYAHEAVVLFVSADWLDEKERALEFLEKQEVKGLSFIKNQTDNEFIDGIHREWSGALPFTIVYGKNSGNVVDYWEAKKSEKRFVEALEKAINEGVKS